MSKLLREPLVHFVLLGALLFIGHGLWQRHITKSDYTITVSAAEIQRQAEIFAAENRREPADEDLEALLFAHVEEQVLMREAQRLGLDSDDTIIRRRLAQKMRFMISDVAPPAPPSEAVLREYFEANKDRFVIPETRSFRHIYFSPGSRGNNLDADVAAARSQLTSANWRQLGDPFMLERQMQNKDHRAIMRDFGRDFAAAVFNLPQGEWSEPIGSALGLHLVFIDDVTPSVMPDFAQVRDQVELAWQEKASRQANQNRLSELLQKYNVVTEE